jgi:hypothetical protein
MCNCVWVFLEASNDFLLFLSCALEIHVPSFYDRHDKRKNVMVFTLFFCFNLDVESTAKMFGLLHMTVHIQRVTIQPTLPGCPILI